MEIIRKEVKDAAVISVDSRKKFLYLAQKAMNCRKIENVMDMFAKINVLPVTISKRHGVKYLDSIYYNLFDRT